MRLTKLHIENFRGIEKFEIDFLDQFTVLIGENGTGKTSVLDALAIGLSSIGIEIPPTRFNQISATSIVKDIQPEDIRMEIFADYHKRKLPLKIYLSALSIDKGISWSRIFMERGKEYPTAEKEHTIFVDEESIGSHIINEDGDILQLKKSYNDPKEDTQLPLIAYYGTRRLWSNDRKVEYWERGYRLDAYKNALDPNFSNQTFLSWYKTYEDEILKFKKDDSLLRAFQNAITTCVEEWSDIGFSFQDNDLKGLLTPENGEPYLMRFGMLSDGYRNLIGMVADMAYRCITLNPQLKENAVTETEGVVLIDEVGLHLHPKWQRKVVDDLKRTFPKVQFIATTHSPFVVQSLKASELVNMNTEVEINPTALTVEEVAIDLMGVPSKYGEENAQQEALSRDYLLKVNELQKANGSAEEILKELDKIEHDISDPAVRAFLKMRRLLHTK